VNAVDQLSSQLAAHRSDADLKAKTVAASRREVEAAERVHADRTADHAKVTAAAEAAAKAFDTDPTEANAVRLSTAQFRLPKSAGAVAAAGDSLAGARSSHEASAASLDASTQAAAKAEKQIALALAATEFDSKAVAVAPRVIEVVDELRGLLAGLAESHQTSAVAGAELAEMTGEPHTPRELAFAASVLGLLRARAIAVHERDVASLLPRDVDTAIGPVVSVVNGALARKQHQLDAGAPISDGQLREVDALIASLHASDNLQQARHRILVASMTPGRANDPSQSVLSLNVRRSAAELGRPR
jgi:hypothetical protein